jgi:hypothetical protein
MRKFIVFKMPDTLWNREYSDKARLRQFLRAVKEGNKPSRWYYDNPAGGGSSASGFSRGSRCASIS